MSSADDPALRLASARGTTDRLRRANLSAILTLVHRDGALSRAEITRRTGLNRSTVGACVADLVELGLVSESMPENGSRAGRPSPIVSVSSSVVAIAVNPEVDALHIGVVGLGGKVLRRIRLETERTLTVPEVVSRATAGIAGLVSGHERAEHVIGMGVAVPGQVRLSDGQVREATHMGWAEEPLTAMLASATGYRASAANAAILGMRAESVFGAGRGVDDFVYFIGGASGVGGGAVTDGDWVTGAAGYAGEFGHTFVRSGGLECACGANGCLEAEVTQQRLLDAVGLDNAHEDQLADALATSASDAVHRLVHEDLELLSIAVRNAVNVFNPSVVVLGGYLDALYRARRTDDEWDLAKRAIRSARESVRVISAALGRDQLMIGAGELAFAELLDDPASYALAAA
ncbi:ROK family transcriptional regulator [Microbacterium sp. STN6]|uniref:ROK family transcriptional regulator n=1 Tax=Microbacterium sp. STN6 TaxID=2995588 RepID=UPI002260983E|nr:ROK family transcriptional regulator [Microbacterium sp. STN6]MCX7520831.1 ROK family transcriptional regulator [Microbacterium sp. STN6]